MNNKQSLMQRLKEKQQLERLRQQQEMLARQEQNKSNPATNVARGVLGGIDTALKAKATYDKYKQVENNPISGYTSNYLNNLNTPSMLQSSIANETSGVSNVSPVGNAVNNQLASVKPVEQTQGVMGNMADNLGDLNIKDKIGNELARGTNNLVGGSDSMLEAGKGINKLSDTIGNAMEGAGNAMPYVNAAMGALSAGENFSKGDYLNGALNIAKPAAMFIPGVGWAVSGAIDIAQMLFNAQKKKEMEAIQKSQEEANKGEQLANQATAEYKQGLAQNQQEKLNNIQNAMMLPTPETPIETAINNKVEGELPNAQTPIADMVNNKLKDVAQPTEANTFNYDTVTDITPPQPSTASKIGDMVNSALQVGRQAMPGVSQTELDNYRASINPADYTTKLNEQETQGFNNWVANNNVPISNDYDMQGYYQKYVSPYEQLSAQGYTPEQIAGVKQGLNGGSQELQDFIQQQGIKAPETDEDIALAREGKFNQLPYDEKTMHFTDEFKMPNHKTFSNESKYATGDAERYAGSWKPNAQTDEDYISPVTKNDMKAEILSGLKDYKNGFNGGLGTDVDGLWGNVGKVANVANNVLSNPYLQGAIAGGIYKATGGDTGKSIQYGVDWAQNKAKSNYYAKELGQQPGILGSFDKGDYSAKTNTDYKNAQIEIRNKLADIQNKRVEIYKMAEEGKLDAKEKDRELRKLELEEKTLNNKAKIKLGYETLTSRERIADKSNATRIKTTAMNNANGGSVSKQKYESEQKEINELPGIKNLFDKYKDNPEALKQIYSSTLTKLKTPGARSALYQLTKSYIKI